MIKKEEMNLMMKRFAAKGGTVEKLPPYIPKYATKHTIYSHFRNKSFGRGGNKPICKISAVYNGFSNYKTKDVENHITAFRKTDKAA